MSEPNEYARTLAQLERMIAEGRDDPALLLDELRKVIFKHRREMIARYLANKHGAVVQNGPFAGMRYLDKLSGGMDVPELVGCSEAELHGVIAGLVRKGYQRIINIGSARGYYAVGLARLMPGAVVYAFETQPKFQSLCAELASRNQVGNRVHQRGTCTVAELYEVALPESLIFCDCEGGELELLDPKQVPALLRCDLVVEAHDFKNPDTSRLLAERFTPSHQVMTIRNAGRNPYQYESLLEFRQSDQMLAVYEGRPGPTPWVYMRTAT